MKPTSDIKHITINGFTLAELLIALAILGIIATFTIPKILDSGSNSQWNATARETAGMVSGAFQSYKIQNSVSATTSIGDLTPYMNYVREETISRADADGVYGGATVDCSTGLFRCFALHSGSYLWFFNTQAMGSTDTTAGIVFFFDPDTAQTNDRNAVRFYLYANGQIRTLNTIDAGTCNTGGCDSPNVNSDPAWFSWSN